MVKGWLLFPLLLLAGSLPIFITFTFPNGSWAKFFAGLGFGPLLVLGSYYVQTGRYSWETLIASLAPGYLQPIFFFSTSFQTGRQTGRGGGNIFVISLGKKDASYLFVVFLLPLISVLLPGSYKNDACVNTHWSGNDWFGWRPPRER